MRVLLLILLTTVAATLIFLLLEASSAQKPISTKATLSSKVVEKGESIVVSIEAMNRSFRKTVVIPGYHRLRGASSSMDGVGFFFKPAGSDYHPNIKYTGLMLDPIWEKLRPREARRYEFYWKPGEADVGEGSLFLTLPDDFEPVEPFKVKVIESSEQAGSSNGG